MVDWDQAIWHAEVPSGSKLVISVRTGSTLKPDRTWSDWSTLTSQGPAHRQFALHPVQDQDDQPGRDRSAGPVRDRLQPRRCPAATGARRQLIINAELPESQHQSGAEILRVGELASQCNRGVTWRRPPVPHPRTGES